MNRGFAVICFTVALDAMGVGLVLPILPGLLRSLGHGGDVERHYGLLLSAYALMQFLCSPVLDDRLLIGCGADALRPTLVQRAGKGAMSVDELLRGFAIPVGTRLS